jgi:hypothetical protein
MARLTLARKLCGDYVQDFEQSSCFKAKELHRQAA